MGATKTPLTESRNATHFFERERDLPSSESFWTSVFALFLLHAAASSARIRCWRTCGGGSAPWFEPHPDLILDVSGLVIDNLAVEPNADAVGRKFRGFGPRLTGISPDIVISSQKSVVFIENKITSSAKLDDNQRHLYLELLEKLRESKDIKTTLIVLMSYGCSPQLFRNAQELQEKAKKKETDFGIVLWEDIFREMDTLGSGLPGLDSASLRPYWRDGEVDCRDWKT